MIKRIAMGLAMGLLLVSMVQAEMVASYDYASTSGKDPADQGWKYSTNYPAGGSSAFWAAGYDTAEVWPGTMKADGWRVIDVTKMGNSCYQMTPMRQQAAAMSKGWTLTWTFTMDSSAWGSDGSHKTDDWFLADRSRQGYNGIVIDTAGANGYAYYIVATADADGNLAIWDRKDQAANVSPTHVLTSGGNNIGYNSQYTLTVTYDGTDAVLTTGDKTFKLYKFPSRGIDRVLFGGMGTPNFGSVVYHKLTLETDGDTGTAAAATETKRATTASDVLDIGSQRQLFFDKYIIDSMSGQMRLKMHDPVDQGKVLDYTEPWEGKGAYNTVIKDGDKYLLYYRAYPEHPKDYPKTIPKENICYAESTDGIHWTKPSLGICEYEGSKDNNIILRDEPTRACHNLTPFIDSNPDADPQQRFKALGGTWKTGFGDVKRLYAYASADGIHWQLIQDDPVLTDPKWAFDSMNVSFWSEDEGRYVLFYRKAAKNKRSIGKAVSDDYVNWTDLGMMKYSDTGSTVPSCQLYTNQTQPYFRARQIFIATPARFFEHRQVLTKDQAEEIGVDLRYFKDTSDIGFMTTRPGSMMYDRTFMSALMGPGIGMENWVSRSNYPSLRIVPTSDTEMSLYVKKNNAQPTVHLRRYTYRIDGITSVTAEYTGGQLLTKPFTFQGSQLSLNYSTSAAGSIKIEIQEPDGTPVPGYTLRDSRELIGDQIERVFDWNGKTDLGALAGKPIRLKFVMEDAELYSFIFE